MRELQLAIKRLADVVLCLAILIFAFPILLMIGILVKTSSPGGVFFVQPRVGKGARAFQLFKFRTMTGSPNKGSKVWTSSDEARITPVGRFLRDYGLDELPQVINIIKGDMSIIGPRPPLPEQVLDYTPRQRRAFQMRPGVLSLAAVRGRRSIPIEKRIEYHVEYVDNWSLVLDLEILWRSLFVVLGRQDASEKPSSNKPTS